MDEALLTSKSTIVTENTLALAISNDDLQNHPSSSWMARNIFCLGFVTGFFIQLSIVGAYALSMFFFGYEYIQEHTGILALLWSIVLCTLGLCVLWSTTAIVVGHYKNDIHGARSNSYYYSKQIRTTVESRFLVGSIASLSSSCFFVNYAIEGHFRWEICLISLVMVFFSWHVSRLLDFGNDDDDHQGEDKHAGQGMIYEEIDCKGEEV